MSANQEFKDLLDKFKTIPFIRPAMLPKIDLYMDQVTTFMEERLGNWRRSPEDKILTKTMINNYTKNKLLPPPAKKKYSPNHLLLLNYTYYLKNILSIGDIKTLLQPMTERYWDSQSGPDMTEIYRRILSLEHQMYRDNHEDLLRKIGLAENAFTDESVPEEDRPYLQRFVFVCLLAFDVSLKKRMMESLIDNMKLPAPEKEKGGRKKEG